MDTKEKNLLVGKRESFIKMSNTIAAISTPIAIGAIGIIKLSGEDSLNIAKKIFSTKDSSFNDNIKPRYVYFGQVNIRNIKDDCLLIYFKAPKSYTGEDVVEIQCHGSIKLSSIILEECVRHGARVANKGEFTKRALLNNKINYLQAQGIIDVINSESESQLIASTNLLNNSFFQEIYKIQKTLIDLITEIEVSFDYPDEYEEIQSSVEKETNKISSFFKKIVRQSEFRKNIKNGITIVILGEPNVGKSSLLNAISGFQKAIVTDIPGTTRDIVETKIEYNGFIFNFFDTAGIRDSDDEIEKIGIKNSLSMIESADLVLNVFDSDDESLKYTKKTKTQLKNKKTIKVYNKTDINKFKNKDKTALYISAKNNENIELLLDRIFKETIGNNVDGSYLSFNSQFFMDRIKMSLKELEEYTLCDDTLDCSIVYLKRALENISEITNIDPKEEVISTMFENFCVGK